MQGTLPLIIPGRLMLDTPKDYHGGDLKNGDIAVVNGTPFYYNEQEGCKFIELDIFDGRSAREAIHANYGWFVDIQEARPISYEIANACHEIGVPCGYLGEHAASGIFNSNRPFLPGVSGEKHLNFLHPQFLKGDDAQAFIESLSELTETEPDKWIRIQAHLRERNPINLHDLQDAKEQFAPELLLPEVLRPIHKYIPADADKWEVTYLTDKIEFLSEEERSIFNAVVEVGWQCSNVAEIINLTETLDCFELQPAINESMYGDFRIEIDWAACEDIIKRLENSKDPAERALVEHFTLLHRAVDIGMYGYHATQEVGGVFTKEGMLTTGGSGEPRTVYRGVQDLPDDYRETQPTPEIRCNTVTPAATLAVPDNKPSVLAEIAESRMKPADPGNKSDPVSSKNKLNPEY